MDQRCQRCGHRLGEFANTALCPACRSSTASLTTAPPRLTPAVWMWSDPGAARAFASRDLPTILRAYRTVNGLSQQALAQLLDYDKSYIAMIERGNALELRRENRQRP